MDRETRRLIYLCSPYRGNIKRNVHYAKLAMANSILLENEAPFVPHLLYPQVLNDKIEEDRKTGMDVAHRVMGMCSMIIVYADYGLSDGMREDIAHAEWLGLGREDRFILTQNEIR